MNMASVEFSSGMSGFLGLVLVFIVLVFEGQQVLVRVPRVPDETLAEVPFNNKIS